MRSAEEMMRATELDAFSPIVSFVLATKERRDTPFRCVAFDPE
jgi:hypothetical protein